MSYFGPAYKPQTRQADRFGSYFSPAYKPQTRQADRFVSYFSPAYKPQTGQDLMSVLPSGLVKVLHLMAGWLKQSEPVRKKSFQHENNNQGAEMPAHECRLISIFVVFWKP